MCMSSKVNQKFSDPTGRRVVLPNIISQALFPNLRTKQSRPPYVPRTSSPAYYTGTLSLPLPQQRHLKVIIDISMKTSVQ